jgi:hypothetical protein
VRYKSKIKKGVKTPEYFQGLWGDRNTANFDEQRLWCEKRSKRVNFELLEQNIILKNNAW